MVTKSNCPIFKRYTISELSERLGYKEATLLGMREGHVKIVPRFKDFACAKLGYSEEELFGTPEEATS